MSPPERFAVGAATGHLTRFFDTMATGGPDGGTQHHLLLLRLATTAFGLPALSATVGVLALGDTEEMTREEGVAASILAMTGKPRSEDGPLYLAALLLELHAVSIVNPDEVAENRVRRMTADRALGEHPESVEMAVMYGVDADGRRYSVARWHTGPLAGTTGDMVVSGPEVPTGNGADLMPTADGARVKGRGGEFMFGELLRAVVAAGGAL